MIFNSFFILFYIFFFCEYTTNVTLPRTSLLTISKSFIRPHLNYEDVIYDQPNNNRLSEKIESIQYNPAVAITGAIRETSRERLYQELGLNL